MPYDSLSKLPSAVKKRSKGDQKQWMAVFNDVFAKTGNETSAFKAAYSAIKMDAEEAREKPITCIASSVFPEWEAAGIYEVQVMRTGTWKKRDYTITNSDLATAVRNFRASSLKPFLDYNHAIADDTVAPGDQKAIGWMADMWIETLDGTKLEPAEAEKSKEKVLVLKATYEVNAEANEKIKAKEYALFSPTWYTDYINPESGDYQGMTIIGGAATNIPFFTGMQEFVAIVAERGDAIKMQDMLPKASLRVVAPAEMEPADAVKALDAMGYRIDSFCANAYGEDEYQIRTPDGGDMAKMIGALADAGFEVESFWQGYIETESKDVKDETKEAPQGGAKQGEETAVAAAMRKAESDKAKRDAEAAQTRWDKKNTVTEIPFSVTLA